MRIKDGSMPPGGNDISKEDIATLDAWIKADMPE
jgi:hypothetical protein